MSNKAAFPLLALPLELREVIYEQTDTASYKLWRTLSHQILNEVTRHSLYTQHTFHIHWPSNFYSTGLQDLRAHRFQNAHPTDISFAQHVHHLFLDSSAFDAASVLALPEVAAELRCIFPRLRTLTFQQDAWNDNLLSVAVNWRDPLAPMGPAVPARQVGSGSSVCSTDCWQRYKHSLFPLPLAPGAPATIAHMHNCLSRSLDPGTGLARAQRMRRGLLRRLSSREGRGQLRDELVRYLTGVTRHLSSARAALAATPAATGAHKGSINAPGTVCTQDDGAAAARDPTRSIQRLDDALAQLPSPAQVIGRIQRYRVRRPGVCRRWRWRTSCERSAAR